MGKDVLQGSQKFNGGETLVVRHNSLGDKTERLMANHSDFASDSESGQLEQRDMCEGAINEDRRWWARKLRNLY